MDTWRIPVNSVMKVRLPQDAGILRTDQETVNFSRMCPLHAVTSLPVELTGNTGLFEMIVGVLTTCHT